MNWVTIRKALYDWVVACTGMDGQKVTWERQRNTPRPEADGIQMKLYVIDDEGSPWVDHEEKILTFANKSITGVSGNTLTSVAHGLVTGDGPVQLTGADLPQPLLEATDYWIIRITADTFRLAAQFEDTGGGDATGNPITPITLTDAGSGAMAVVAQSNTLRAGEEIEYVQRGMQRMTLQLFSYVTDDTGMDGAIATLHRVASRYKLPSNIAILEAVNVGVTNMDRTRSMLGTRDATLFEPRAWLDVGLSLTYEERENGTIIGRTIITEEAPAPGWVEIVENEEL